MPESTWPILTLRFRANEVPLRTAPDFSFEDSYFDPHMLILHAPLGDFVSEGIGSPQYRKVLIGALDNALIDKSDDKAVALTLYRLTSLYHEIRHFVDVLGSPPGFMLFLRRYLRIIKAVVEGTDFVSESERLGEALLEGCSIKPGWLRRLATRHAALVRLQLAGTNMAYPGLILRRPGAKAQIAIIGLRTLTEATALAFQHLTLSYHLPGIGVTLFEHVSTVADAGAVALIELVRTVMGQPRTHDGLMAACLSVAKLGELAMCFPGHINMERLFPEMWRQVVADGRDPDDFVDVMNPGWRFIMYLQQYKSVAAGQVEWEYYANDITSYKNWLNGFITEMDRRLQPGDGSHDQSPLAWLATIYHDITRPMIQYRIEKGPGLDIYYPHEESDMCLVPPFWFDGSTLKVARPGFVSSQYLWFMFAARAVETWGRGRRVYCPIKVDPAFKELRAIPDLCQYRPGCGTYARDGDLERQPECTFREFLSAFRGIVVDR